MIDFWLITGAGLVNGLNVCALGLMLTFAGYLLVFGEKSKKDLLLIGGLYLAGVFVSYLFVGLVFYQVAFYLQQLALAFWLEKGLGLMLVFFALMQVKYIVWGGGRGIGEKWFFKYLGRVSKPMAFGLGFITVAVATPCILPSYVGVASVLVRSGLPLWQILTWFLYFNGLFILPMVVVLILVYKGKSVMMMKEWSHGAEKWGRLLMVVLLGVIAFWLLS